MKRFVLACIAAAFAHSAQAETVTFTGIQDFEIGGVFQEAGFQVAPIDSANALGGNGSEALHVEIFGGPFSSDFSLTRIGGGLFNAVSVFVEPIGIIDLIQGAQILPNIAFTGLRNGQVVGQVRATTQDNQDKTVDFGGVLNNVDSVQISGFLAGNEDLFFTGNDINFKLDNFVVTPVAASSSTTVIPLPASGLLLVGAMGLFAGVAARRKRRAA